MDSIDKANLPAGVSVNDYRLFRKTQKDAKVSHLYIDKPSLFTALYTNIFYSTVVLDCWHVKGNRIGISRNVESSLFVKQAACNVPCFDSTDEIVYFLLIVSLADSRLL